MKRDWTAILGSVAVMIVLIILLVLLWYFSGYKVLSSDL